MNQTSNKKDQFLNQRKNNIPILIGIVAILIVGVISLIFLNLNGKNNEITYYGDPVVSERSYIGKVIKMTNVETQEDGKTLQIPLDVVDQSNIVYFESTNQDQETVPMMAYITPSGRLFAGSSLCEPCRGKKFSLAGETIVCDTCKTTYNIENHEFISGAKVCGQYPPVNMNPKIIDGNIVIQKEEILNWEIRVK